MPEVLVATPLKHFAVTQEHVFADGIAIRELSPILWDVSIIKGFISEKEREELAATRYWLCAKGEGDSLHDWGEEYLNEKARHAALALQIICPTGAKHVFLNFQKTIDGYDNTGSYHPRELCSPLLGRVTRLEDQGLKTYFDTVFQGITRAFGDKIIRLQNPINLLEHGMQICHQYLGTLLFVMGLDILFMAGEKAPFMKRVGGFLGLDTLVFPPDSILNRQPRTVVREVLNDIYDLRNFIAHGREIPRDPYRTKRDVITNGERINYGDYYYAELMHEAALFVLTVSLRKIFTEGLLGEVSQSEAAWRQKLQVYEHRYKESGGHEATKQRRR